MHAAPQVKTFDPDHYFAQRRSCETMLREGFLEVPLVPRFLETHVACILKGMYLITEDARLAELLPWHVHARDAYGAGYEQEVGFEFKDDDERKWKFQYAASCYGQGQSYPAELRDFFSSLFELELQALEITTSMAREFEIYCSSKLALSKCTTHWEEMMQGATCITRVLRYRHPHAKAHIDRAFMTPHWFGTHEGLRLYRPDGTWVGVDETSYGHVALFPGEKFAAVSRGLLGTYGTPHKVECAEEPTEDRFAIVSFVHPKAHPEDCTWLRKHRATIEAYEHSLRT